MFNSLVVNSPVRVQRCLPVLAASVVLLTGCGVAQTQFHPGIAARVGDDTITTKHVDEVTADYCTAVEKVSKGQTKSADQSPQPLRYLSHEFATDLIIKSAVSQLADQYDVTPTSAYNGNLSTLKPQLVTLSADQRDISTMKRRISIRPSNTSSLLPSEDAIASISP